MIVPFLDLGKQLSIIRNEIDTAISEVINSTIFIKGDVVKIFEDAFSKKIDVAHTIGVGNGTDALFLILKTLGIGRGDEVITPANTFIATAEAITASGAKVVFVDVNADSYNIDCEMIERVITIKTKAILPVHLYGQVAEMDEIFRLAVQYQLFVIEDAAQAHFSKYKMLNHEWKMAGTFGQMAAFSFFPGKNLGAFGDAGAIVTNNTEYAIKARMLANHGRLSKYEHEFEGYNSRMDSIQAAVLNVKLNHLESWTNNRRKIATLYSQLLFDIPQLQLPTIKSNQEPAWHLFVILAQQRNQLQKFLKSKGVSTGIHYPKSLPNLPAYKYLGHKPDDFPVATNLQEKILSLPIFPEMTIDQVTYVCSCIKQFFQKTTPLL